MPAIPNVASVGVAIVPNMDGFKAKLLAGLGPGLLVAGGVASAIGAVVTAAVDEFVPLEATFARMVGLAGVAESEIDGLKQSVLELGPAVGKSPQELADALMFIVSSGFQGAAALDVLEASARAGAAGLGEVAVIADAVTSAINAYGPDVLTASRATDVLVAAVREGKIEADQFAPVLGKLLPTASAMGIAFEDVAGILAAMSRTGFDAAEASTALGAVMSTLLKPSKGASDTLAAAGLSMGELRDIAGEPGGLVEVMRLLDIALGDDEEALSKVVPNVRAFRGIMNLLAQDAEVVDDVLAGVADSVGATDSAFEAVADTAEHRLAEAVAKLKVALVDLGAEAAPSVVAGVEAITDVLVDLVRELKPLLEGLGFLTDQYEKVKEAGAEWAESDNVLVRGWGAAIGELGLLSILTGNYTGVVDAAADSVNATATAVQYMADASKDDLIPALDDSSGVLDGLGGSADGAAGGLGNAAAEAGTLAAELNAAKEAGDGVIGTLLNLTNPLFAAINRAVSLKDLIERIDEATDTEPKGFRNPEEVARYRQELLELAASLELASQGAGGANEALDIMAQLFQTTRPELIDWLASFGIVIDEFGNLGTAITDGVVRGAGNLQRDLTRSLDQQIAGTLATLRNKYEIRSPSGVWERALGIPLKEGLIGPSLSAGRELQAAVRSVIDQGMSQAVPRGGPAVAPVATGDTITIAEGAIQVHNATPERASESLQSAPLRMTLQGLVRR